MPETNDKGSYRKQVSNSKKSQKKNAQTAVAHRTRSNGQQQIMDFTSTQELKIRAGDVRMARLQISLAKLRQDMEQSNKLVEQLSQEVNFDANTILN
ncbi:hypothetical protein KR093_008739 [Drosophila rubida]|uniref:Uncharacterized protein n=1 Tax=Drosophila rubida TaxID=30044 RepID=A0AAD4K5M1_9MUSC|nr:hypothetical protein KR093_008739 [Drosophila rubida]